MSAQTLTAGGGAGIAIALCVFSGVLAAGFVFKTAPEGIRSLHGRRALAYAGAFLCFVEFIFYIIAAAGSWRVNKATAGGITASIAVSLNRITACLSQPGDTRCEVATFQQSTLQAGLAFLSLAAIFSAFNLIACIGVAVSTSHMMGNARVTSRFDLAAVTLSAGVLVFSFIGLVCAGAQFNNMDDSADDDVTGSASLSNGFGMGFGAVAIFVSMAVTLVSMLLVRSPNAPAATGTATARKAAYAFPGATVPGTVVGQAAAPAIAAPAAAAAAPATVPAAASIAQAV